MASKVVSACCLVIALVTPSHGISNTLDAPEGEVQLVISGNLQLTNAEDSDGNPIAKLDMAMLEALPVTTVVTKNPWVEERTTYEGVTINTLLEHVGAKSFDFLAEGIDGYTAELRGIDFAKYPIIVAYKREGDYMSIRDLGPLWIIYPFDDYPELDTEYSGVTSVWQLIEMKIY